MQTKGEIAAWLRLQLTPGVGNASMRRLLAAFSLPEQIFQQSHAALSEVLGPKRAENLRQAPPNYEQDLERLFTWLEQPGQRLITVGDADYPRALLASPDAPLWLFVQCADAQWWQSWAEQEQAPMISIIGSRQPTPQGLRVAQAWSQSLAEAGLSVVSGLALGVDAAAHRGALQAPAWQAGRSIAVVGTGLDVVYPRQHATLAQEILDAGGAIISEYPLGTPAIAANFPKRNRIIAGLSLGVLVVEAALQSGSLITARLAMEANREVFAVPGSIFAPQYQGCHALLKQGAQLVESAQDILQGLPAALISSSAPASPVVDTINNIAIQTGFTGEIPKNTKKNHINTINNSKTIGSPAEADPVSELLQAMGFDVIALDALALALPTWPAAQLQVELLNLELAGKIVRQPGGLYQRVF